MMYRFLHSFPGRLLALCMALSQIIWPLALQAQTVQPLEVQQGAGEMRSRLFFNNAPLEQVLDMYSRLTGKTLIKAPNVPAISITLKSQTRLTNTEALIAIESALALNNIAFVPLGDTFLKVVQSPTAKQEATSLVMPDQKGNLTDSDHLETHIVELRHTSIQEVQPIIQGLLRSYGNIQPVERSNAMMITDSASSLKQILQVIEYLDQPVLIREEPRIYELQYAAASDVAGRLNELISQSQEDQQQTQRRTPANNSANRNNSVAALRQRIAQAQAAGGLPGGAANNNAAPASLAAEQAQRGIVQGKVMLVPDERTNILIVISDPVNFPFFDRIINVLDRQTEPELIVKFFLLEFADAEEAAATLNELIGAATGDNPVANSTGGSNAAPGENRSQSLQDFIRNRNTANNNAAAANTTSGASNINAPSGSLSQLSESTRILADTRTNGLLIMGKKQDIPILEDVIRKLDVMLAQVLIEAVIMEVNLSDGIDYGVDWLQRSLTVVNENVQGPNGGVAVSEPVYSFGGGQSFVSGDFRDAAAIDRDTPLSSGALTYFATFYDMNIDAIVRAAASSSDARVIATPVVLTTDNTEARITIGEQRPIPTTSSTTAGGVIRSTFDYRDIGINLTVTPRINPEKFVIMDVVQSADNVGNTVTIDGNEVPIITRREVEASIGVSNRTTVVLGGLVQEDDRNTVAKVPILGDIPIIGNLFRDTSKSSNRSEIIIMITPYVLLSAEDAVKETRRIKNATKVSDTSWFRGWNEGGVILDDGDAIPPKEGGPKRQEREGVINDGIKLIKPKARIEDEPATFKRKGLFGRLFGKDEAKQEIPTTAQQLPPQMPQATVPVLDQAADDQLLRGGRYEMPADVPEPVEFHAETPLR